MTKLRLPLREGERHETRAQVLDDNGKLFDVCRECGYAVEVSDR